jgi:tetratricopeptide (TPR) repeat protein
VAGETDDGYVRRAELLADLGRYDDAVTELGFAISLDPRDPIALSLLACVHLAADRPADALAAADAAVAAAPRAIRPLVQRGMALVDLRRFGEAADIAYEILGISPDDAHAQLSAAAILGEARNGQRALDAAWRAVTLAPEESQAHLVLGVVAARLGLYGVAERAYREALRLDPALEDAHHHVGVARLDQRRYAETLGRLAEAADVAAGRARRSSADGVRQLVRYGAAFTIIAVLLIGFLDATNGLMARVLAFVFGVVGLVAVGRHVHRGPSAYVVLAGPAFVLGFALVGGPWPLVFAVLAAAMSGLVWLARTRA